ncbi:hypothetical protein [Aeromicrobium sp. CTD01-1L150]|uniref:hypothetical protein n=1 Tax=Aeromicrobium sp. CTD01-1L150 TaxID=3341830 RepID=UPI0035C00196
MSEPTQHGFGRALVAVYAVFALSATARSTYQLLSKAGEAPVAYSLSAVAGLVYLLATVALATDRRALAGWTIGFELLGVLAVGLVTVVDGELFPDATVWSGFGAGYGYVPLVLPLLGLWWLRRTGGERPPRTHTARGQDD